MNTESDCKELDSLLRAAADAAASAEMCRDKGWGGDSNDLDREAEAAERGLVERMRRHRAESPEVIETWVAGQIRALEAFLAQEEAAADWLRRAIAMDARYAESARADSDFARVREAPEFQAALR